MNQALFSSSIDVKKCISLDYLHTLMFWRRKRKTQEQPVVLP